jgi:hypothetical protein
VRWVPLCFAAGCSFGPHVVSGDGGIDAVDVRPPDDVANPIAVAHVPASVTATFAGTASVTFANVIIDTRSGAEAPISSQALPSGAVLLTTPQDGGGPELAIFEVGDLEITGTLRVVGVRPLVIIARSTMVVNAIDASAAKNQPGGGGYDPGMGPGAGGPGGVVGSADAGGGGAGFGTNGGVGQTSGAATGAGGAGYGTSDLATLDGGSGGGTTAPTCAGLFGGAGGGAIQLYAGVSVQIDGTVAANGGGGAGGKECANEGTSGGGGGSGGAIYIQTPMLLGAGVLLAQGGAGGGGSDVSTQTYGTDGANGPSTIAAAVGGVGTGTGVGGENNSGASGGFRDAAPPTLTALSGMMSGNGGGGGGAAGRIVVRGASIGSMSSSPLAVTVP